MFKKKPSGELKKWYCTNDQITARQYNSIKKQLDGRITSKLELAKLYIQELKDKIKSTTKWIASKEAQKKKQHVALLGMKGNENNFFKKVSQYRKLRGYIHQKKRKLHSMTLKLQKIEKDYQSKTVRICFGSKKLFKKQFNLEENNITFKEWKKEWIEKRAAQFTFIGSKDETFGNQSCTYDLKNNLRIRVFTKDEGIYGNYVILPNVVFSYGQENIDQAKIPSIGYTTGKGNEAKYYRALTWKFVCKNNNWYANVTVDVDMSEIKSLKGNGIVSVDFNAGFLAVSDVDRFGNILNSFQVAYKTHHCTSEQTEQSLSEAIKIVVQYAVEKAKPIGIESLDFKKKKQNLKQMSRRQAKILSGFAYSTYQSMMERKCERAGIELISVNPAYTSQIGHHKFMKKYGISSHESAALVIRRRCLGFNRMEKIPKNLSVKSNVVALYGGNAMLNL